MAEIAFGSADRIAVLQFRRFAGAQEDLSAGAKREDFAI